MTQQEKPVSPDNTPATEEWRTWRLEQCREWITAEANEAFNRYLNGRKEYGPTFVGDPLHHLKEELLDTLFYRWSAERERAELLAHLQAAQQEIQRLKQELETRENPAR